MHLALLPACGMAAWCAVRSGVRRHGRRSVAVPAVGGVLLLAVAVALPHAPGVAAETPEDSAEERAAATTCASGCCHAVAPPAADDGPVVRTARVALPWLTPLGGGLLVLAHLFNLFLPGRSAPAGAVPLDLPAPLA